VFETGKYERIGFELYRQYSDYQKKFVSLCHEHQIYFLLGLINSHTFKDGRPIETALELGVSHGVTSLYILKEGCKKHCFNLFGLDLSEGEHIAQAVFGEATPEELSRYHLFKKHTSYDIEKIASGQKFDMVFIDAAHSHPHPIIDLIHVIPYLHEESIVLLHDVIDYMKPNAWGESFIYSAWKEEKYRTVFLDKDQNPGRSTTLGCIKIPSDRKELIGNIEPVLRTPFRASPWKFDEVYLGVNKKDLIRLKAFMEKHYDKEFAESTFNQLHANFEDYMKNHLLYIHETRFFDYLVMQFADHSNRIDDICNELDESRKALSQVEQLKRDLDESREKLSKFEQLNLEDMKKRIDEMHRWKTRIQKSLPYRIARKLRAIFK